MTYLIVLMLALACVAWVLLCRRLLGDLRTWDSLIARLRGLKKEIGE
jgi:hypothetical protein